jgi:hypothetical protein
MMQEAVTPRHQFHSLILLLNNLFWIKSKNLTHLFDLVILPI